MSSARRRLGFTAVLIALTACAPAAHEEGAEEGPDHDDGYPGTAMADHVYDQVDVLADKFIQLAEAMPEGAYDWAPMEGTRSVGAVFAHVAADNYFIPALLGMVDEESGVSLETGIMAYEEARGSKAEIIAELERSFAFMKEAYEETRGDLATEVQFGGSTIITGDLWVRATTHLHEHLGQAIAYARANGVTPPWSM